MRFSAASLQRRIVRRRNVTTARAVAAGKAGGLNKQSAIVLNCGGHQYATENWGLAHDKIV